MAEEMGLRGKVVVVTGAAAGLGRATALRFAEEGARVAAWDVDGESGSTLAGEIRAEGIADGCFCAFQMVFRDQYGGITQDAASAAKGELVTGTSDWINDAVETLVPEEAVSVEARVIITGAGTAWVRRLMMLKQ